MSHDLKPIASEHPNYKFRYFHGKTAIDYKLTPRDWFYLLFNLIIGLVLICFPAYLFYSSKTFSWTVNAILVAVFFILIMLWGTFRLFLASKIIFLPKKSIFLINYAEKNISFKLIFFKRLIIPFSEIKSVQLISTDEIVKDAHRGVTYYRRLYFTQLQFLLKNGEIKKAHKFLSRNIFIAKKLQSETNEVDTISLQVAKLIAKEAAIRYEFLGKRNK